MTSDVAAGLADMLWEAWGERTLTDVNTGSSFPCSVVVVFFFNEI